MANLTADPKSALSSAGSPAAAAPSADPKLDAARQRGLVAIPRSLFRAILERIRRLKVPSAVPE